MLFCVFEINQLRFFLYETSFPFWIEDIKQHISNPVDTGRKLNVHMTLRRCPGRFLNVLCKLNLRPVSAGK